MAVLRVLAALSLLSAIACSDKAPATAATSASHDDKTSGSAASRPPPIHFDQISVLTGDGRPKEQEAYHALLDNCHKGGLATRALTPSDEEKLGRIHVEAWIGADEQSRHEERWTLANSSMCEFSLTYEDHTEIVDANGRSTSIDGVTHQVDVQELGKPAPVSPLAPEDEEMIEAARKAGWTRQGNANSNGAECAVWQDTTGFQVCVWTGGRQWGYSTNGPIALKDGMSPGDAIVLWAHPGRYASWQLETREFSVGKALDRRAFAVPASAITHGKSP